MYLLVFDMILAALFWMHCNLQRLNWETPEKWVTVIQPTNTRALATSTEASWVRNHLTCLKSRSCTTQLLKIFWTCLDKEISESTFYPYFKVKRWFTGFGELSFRWMQICIGSPMRRSSLWWVVGRVEETSTYSWSVFCTVNCQPTGCNYQLSLFRSDRDLSFDLRGGRHVCHHPPDDFCHKIQCFQLTWA